MKNKLIWFKKLFGYVICRECQTQFKKNKNTSCGFVNNKSVYWCNKCSNIFIKDIFNGKNPLKHYESRRENGM